MLWIITANALLLDQIKQQIIIRKSEEKFSKNIQTIKPQQDIIILQLKILFN